LQIICRLIDNQETLWKKLKLLKKKMRKVKNFFTHCYYPKIIKKWWLFIFIVIPAFKPGLLTLVETYRPKHLDNTTIILDFLMPFWIWVVARNNNRERPKKKDRFQHQCSSFVPPFKELHQAII